MHFVPASTPSILAFLLIVLSVLVALVAGVYVAHRNLREPASSITLKVGIGILVWLGLSSIPVASGAILDHPIPGFPLFFAAVNIAGILFAFSRIGRNLALGLPVSALVAFQGFRLPLELVLHSWAGQGTIPETMTWTGQNLDIIAGTFALLAAPLAARSRQVAWAVNVIGFGLLLNVFRVAVMSSPLPFAWGVQPPLMLAGYLPYAWIGSVCVAGALTGHLILTRALLLKRG